MGCDIHGFVESKNDEGVWVQETGFVSDFVRHEDIPAFQTEEYKDSATPIDNRNYQLFGFLAGVRSDITPCLAWLADPDDPTPHPHSTRGVPDDVSGCVNTEVLTWEGDGHSHSWLTLRELVAGFAASTIAGEADGFADQLTFTLDQLKERSRDGEGNDVRIVFWFDN